MSLRPHVAVAAALALLPFLVYPQFLSDDAFLYGYDSGQSHLARFRILRHALVEEGSLPLWQTTSYAGSPFHANPENATLYPPVLLAAALFPPLLAMNLTILTSLSLAIAGMYLLCARLWGRLREDEDAPSTAGAAIAALAFGLGYFTRFDAFNLVTYGAAHALIPWVFLAADGLVERPGPRPAAALALAFALQVFTGGHYVFAYTALALAIWIAALGPRRPVLPWAAAAGGLAVLLVSAKLVPFLDWVATTNRQGPLPPEVSRGVTLAGPGGFSWSVLATQLSLRSSHFLTFALAAPCLLLLRRGVARVVLGLALLGLLIGVGWLHDPLLAHVPPFDRIRNANRAWTLTNAFLPLAAGLGVNALLARLPRGGGRRLVHGLVALIVAPALLPLLLDTGRHQEALDEPYSHAEVVALHPHWLAAAEEAGTEWRVMNTDVRDAGTKNEQFIASALGLETPAGFFGFAYPRAIAEHAYPDRERVSDATRARRLDVLSVGVRIGSDRGELRARDWEGRRTDPAPGGIDGEYLTVRPVARPRAFVPGRVTAVEGDVYARLDRPSFEPWDEALVSIDGGAPPGATFGEQQAGGARFTRLSTHATEIVRAEAAAGAWVIVSETWPLYGGWVARAGGREVPILPADGVASALFLEAGEERVVVTYEPGDVALGFALGGLGLLGCVVLLLPRRGQRPSSPSPIR